MSNTSRPIVDRLFWPLTRISPDITILLLAYVALYSGLIVAGHGVPYVMDNNETFSSLNHAYNLWHFDFFKSMGLADEAMSPFAAAHPVTHTHQGNFPRLFSFVLYALGARSAESQIWITTLTVGSASTVMAYVFFRRIGGRLFAAIAITFLLTNYLMFAQWQVNTYRVWHGFLLFAALLCVHGISEWPVWRWMLGSILTFAALFYGELIFAAFVAISTALYAAWVHRFDYRRLLATWFVQGIGAALAFAILITQLVLHLGWDDFLTDIRLTFFARNLVTDKASLLELLSSFYGSRNIVFLYNLNPEAGTSTWRRLLSSIFEFQFAYYTPVIATVCSFVVLAAFLAPRKYPWPRPEPNQTLSSFVAIAILLPWLFLVLLAVLGSRVFVGTALPEIGSSRALLMFISGGTAIAIVGACFIQWLPARLSPSGATPGLLRSALAGLYLFGCAVFVGMQRIYYDPTTAPIWQESLSPLPASLTLASIVGATLFGCTLILCGRLSILGRWANVPSKIAPFFISGVIAYMITYHLSGGYVVSGYLVRLCPFLTFHISSILALGFFVVVAAAVTLFGKLRYGFSTSYLLAAGTATCALVLTMIAGWVTAQANAYRLLPPDQFAFANIIKRMSAPEDGIVSNTYAVPFGIYGGTWAYAHADFWKQLMRTGRIPDTTSNPYLWLADRKRNVAYRTPAIYVCFAPASSALQVRVVGLAFPAYHVDCSADVARFDKLDSETRKIADLLARDEKNDQWAIFRLNLEKHE